jgi:hypothetical protein
MRRDRLPLWRRYLPQLLLLGVGLLAVVVVRDLLQDDDHSGKGFLAGQPRVVDPVDDDGAASSSTTSPEEADEATRGLQRVALRLGDLPGGWTEAVEVSAVQPCPDHDPAEDVEPEAAHRVAFSGGDGATFLASVLAEFGSAGQAEDFIDAATDAIGDCESYELDGREYELERFTVRGLGDQSVAARITGDGPSGSVGGPLYYVRVGPRVVTVALVSAGGAAGDDLARTAVAAVVARLG